MKLSELIAKLQELQAEWGDIRVKVSPFSFSAEERARRAARKICWWCKGANPDMVSERAPVSNLEIKINRDEISRDPEPSAWGYPGIGPVRHDGNPAREVIL